MIDRIEAAIAEWEAAKANNEHSKLYGIEARIGALVIEDRSVIKRKPGRPPSRGYED